MKKHLLLLWGGLILSITVALAQPFDKMSPSGPGSMPQLPDGYVLVKVTNSLTKFDLDFPGGTPEDLVKAVEKVIGKPLNTIIPDECSELKISAVSVKNVTVAQLFDALTSVSKKEVRYVGSSYDGFDAGGKYDEHNTTYGFKSEGVPSENSIWYFYWDKGPMPVTVHSPSPNVCKFYQLSPYLEAGYKVEDITTAVETAWKMFGVTNAPDISYHKDTKILIVVGEEDKVDLIGGVLKQLSTTPKQKPNDKDLPKSKDL